MENDRIYMERALDLAALGREWVSPNPMVGCVLVHNDRIIGEGFHQKYGEAHAEVNAIQQVTDKAVLSEATAYVTLEPCAHHGKTPPCVDLLIEHRIKRVVICNQDPFPSVSGRGLARLQAAGITTETGLMAQEGEELNKRFFKVHRTGLPYIILKWAETADGFIGSDTPQRLKISNPTTNITVHRWRAEEDAILVGSNTVLADNPQLNVRHWTDHKQPVRIVLGNGLEHHLHLNVFDKTSKTIVFNRDISEVINGTEFIAETDLLSILTQLVSRGVNSVLVEGGRKIHETFISQGLFDEIRVIKNDLKALRGTPAPALPPSIWMFHTQEILNDKLFFFRKLPTI